MKYVGVDIGGTNLKAGLVDESGVLLATQKMKVASIADDEGLAWTVASLVQELARTVDIPVSDVASVGVGVPGTVEIRSGSINYTCNLPLRNVPLRKLFHRYLSIPLYIENDANCAALAEYLVGAGRDSKRFVTVTLGTGVGAGIIVDGKIWSGAHGAASELGHLIIEVDGIPCTCGKCGCTERYCSATAIIRMAKEACALHPDCAILKAVNGDVDKITAKTVFDLAKEGDDIASRVFRRYVKYLTIAINNVVSFLDPDMIVLGGGVSRAGDFLLDAVRELLPKYLMYPVLPMPEIALAQLGNDAGIIGAALLGR